MKVNVSMLKTWMTCPLQAKFKDIETRPQLQNAKGSFGTCIHDALDYYNLTGDYEEALKRFYDTWANPEKLNCMPDVWPKNTTYGQLRKKGKEILDSYYEKNKWEDRDIIVSEHRFLVPFGDHELSGIVDLVQTKKSTGNRRVLQIVDFKSNAKKPNLDTLRMDIQFTAYVYASLQPEFWTGNKNYPAIPDGLALYEEFKDMDRKAIWYHLWDNKEINTGDRDDNDFLRLYRCTLEVVNAIEKDVYVPNISGDTCTWCSYQDICKAVIPIRSKMGRMTEEESAL